MVQIKCFSTISSLPQVSSMLSDIVLRDKSSSSLALSIARLHAMFTRIMRSSSMERVSSLASVPPLYLTMDEKVSRVPFL